MAITSRQEADPARVLKLLLAEPQKQVPRLPVVAEAQRQEVVPLRG